MLYSSSIKDFNGKENSLPTNVSLFFKNTFWLLNYLLKSLKLKKKKKDNNNIMNGLEELCQHVFMQIRHFLPSFMKNFCSVLVMGTLIVLQLNDTSYVLTYQAYFSTPHRMLCIIIII